LDIPLNAGPPVEEAVLKSGNIPVHVIVPVAGNAGFLVAQAAVFPAVLFKMAPDRSHTAFLKRSPRSCHFFPNNLK
jgi:hypothetical protein